MMGADDGAHALERVREIGEFLSEDRVLLDESAFRFVEGCGGAFPAFDELAWDPDEADVVQPGADLERAMFGAREMQALGQGAAEFIDAAGLASERGVEGLHR